MKPRVHFVHIYEAKNTGEMLCGPYEYFGRLFCADYELFCHDIRTLNLNKIRQSDWVILGGGGLFEVREDFQNTINAILKRTYKVVSWACGHNMHFGRDIKTKIRYKSFFYLTVRDFGLEGEEYLPCVSCMSPLLDLKKPIARHFGIIEHLDYKIDEFSYDKISNAHAPLSIFDFISSSEVIITNSYHVVYWSTLMRKKVILYKPFSTKFNHLEFAPRLYSGDIAQDEANCKVYENALEDCRKRNIDFANRLYSVMRSIDF